MERQVYLDITYLLQDDTVMEMRFPFGENDDYNYLIEKGMKQLNAKSIICRRIGF